MLLVMSLNNKSQVSHSAYVFPKSHEDFERVSKKLFLMPGELACSKAEALMTTLLGSCVAVVLHDPISKVGGLNHYLLPEPMSGEAPSGRYGNYALKELLRQMILVGADPLKIQAKIFGGANVLNNNSIGEIIGRANVSAAESFLKKHSIPIIRKDISGTKGRKITFNTFTFEVLVSVQGGK